MKKKKPFLLIGIGFLLIVISIFMMSRNKVELGVIEKQISSSSKMAKTKKDSSLNESGEELSQLSHAKKNLRELNSILAEKELSSAKLLEKLSSLKLSVVKKEDTNEYTGTMLTIRTTNHLPGTRNFHAQFMIAENGEEILQHLSFEYRPGEHALRDAAQILAEAMNFEKKKIQDDFVSWSKDGLIYWIKKQSQQDLDYDPYFSHGPSDRGTIRIAREVDVHSEDE